MSHGDVIKGPKPKRCERSSQDLQRIVVEKLCILYTLKGRDHDLTGMCFFGCVPSKVVNVMSLGWMSFTENFYKVLKLQKTNIRMFIRPNLSPKLVPDFLVHQLIYDGLFKNNECQNIEEVYFIHP